MKKILTILAVAVLSIFSLSSCSKDDETAKSSLTNLNGTSWYISDPTSAITINFATTSFNMEMESALLPTPIVLTGNYVYNNPDITTSNISIEGNTMSGTVSEDGELLYLVFNGEKGVLTRKK